MPNFIDTITCPLCCGTGLLHGEARELLDQRGSWPDRVNTCDRCGGRGFLEDSPREQAARLLRDIRAFRARYENGELPFLDWVKARRLCVREAEVLGCTDELLSLMHGGAA